MKKPYRAVFSLWVTPFFSEGMQRYIRGMTSNIETPPRINHDSIDYPALISFFGNLFPYGPIPKIRIANDTIDQTVLHQRSGHTDLPPRRGQVTGGSIKCEDFAKALLECARKQEGDIIDVRAAWKPLHYLTDRNNAPPPSIIPFVTEFIDFEDMAIWHNSAYVSLGLPFLSPMDAIDLLEKNERRDVVGTLPSSYKKQLDAIFKMQFDPYPTTLDRAATGKIPKIYSV